MSPSRRPLTRFVCVPDPSSSRTLSSRTVPVNGAVCCSISPGAGAVEKIAVCFCGWVTSAAESDPETSSPVRVHVTWIADVSSCERNVAGPSPLAPQAASTTEMIATQIAAPAMRVRERGVTVERGRR